MTSEAPAELPPPVISDLTTQTSGSNISAELTEAIPMARNISAVVFLTPNVKSGGGTGAANPSIGGSSGFENQYVFDGVNGTNAGYGALGAFFERLRLAGLGHQLQLRQGDAGHHQRLRGGVRPGHRRHREPRHEVGHERVGRQHLQLLHARRPAELVQDARPVVRPGPDPRAAGISFAITGNATLQLTSVPELRGRVMALYTVVFIGSTPIGSPIAGWVGEHLDPRVGLAGGGAVAIVAGLVAAVSVARGGVRAGGGAGRAVETP